MISDIAEDYRNLIGFSSRVSHLERFPQKLSDLTVFKAEAPSYSSTVRTEQGLF